MPAALFLLLLRRLWRHQFALKEVSLRFVGFEPMAMEEEAMNLVGED